MREQTDQNPYVIHSTYLVNLATPKDDLFEKSLNCLQSELDAAEQLGPAPVGLELPRDL